MDARIESHLEGPAQVGSTSRPPVACLVLASDGGEEMGGENETT